MTQPLKNDHSPNFQAPATTSWSREIAFALIAIGTGIGAGVLLKNKEVTDDPKSLGIAGGVTIGTYSVLKLLFSQERTKPQLPNQPKIQESKTDKTELPKPLSGHTTESPTEEKPLVPLGSPKELSIQDKKEVTFSKNPYHPPQSILKRSPLAIESDFSADENESDTSHSDMYGNTSFESNTSGYCTSGSEGEDGDLSNNSFTADALDAEF